MYHYLFDNRMKRRSVKLFIHRFYCFLFALFISFTLVAQSPGQILQGGLSLYPKAVVVAPGATIQFCALLTKNGCARTPANLRWHADMGTISATGRYEAPAKAGTYVVQAILSEHKMAISQVVVRIASTEQKPKAAARILIIRREIKSPDFMTMKLKARVKITGTKAHRLLLYAINTKGHAKVLESKAVQDGTEVDLKVTYPSLETKKLRYVLQDGQARTLAKLSHRAN